jgi:hypothetical protein
MVARSSSGVAKKKTADRFYIEVRGSQYFVIDRRSGMTMAGPFGDRTEAFRQADALERSMGW